MARRRIRLDDSGRPRDPVPAPASTAPAVCDCPRLDAADWHEVESDWSDIQFVGTHTTAVFGVPVGLSGLRGELEARAEAAGAAVPPDAMLLFGEGRFRRPVMLEVENAPDDSRSLIRPGGVVFSRLLPAPFGEVKKLAEETGRIATTRYGRHPHALWIWYLTCRLCSAERNFETLFVAHFADADD